MLVLIKPIKRVGIKAKGSGMNILSEAKKIHKILVEFRRDFHLYPELSMQEYRTANRIEEELDKLGIEHY